jgi:DNA polymerase (family 10)
VNPDPTNDAIAARLEHIADLLEAQDANPFRIASYRRAASHLREWDRPAATQLRCGGVEALRAIEGVGEGLAATIAELIETGHVALLDRLESEAEPEKLLQRLPGVGPKLAHRLHDALGIVTLEELEQAAHDGRLDRVDGVGRKKAETIRAALAGMLGRRRAWRGTARSLDRPSVETLLAVDAEYLAGAARGTLQKIAPRRFNPERTAWLPIHHCARDGWEFTALFSNTQRAHELGRTHDWVVIYYHRNRHEDQCTVITAMSGPFAGQRIVRGREDECRALLRRASR